MNTSRKQTVAADLSDLIKTVRADRGDPAAVADPPPAHVDVDDELHESVGESAVAEPPATNPPELPRTTDAPELNARATSAAGKRAALKKPVGKRSRLDYQLAGLYLRRSTILAVKRVLLTTEKDMSELTEELLTTWLETRKGAATTRPRVEQR